MDKTPDRMGQALVDRIVPFQKMAAQSDDLGQLGYKQGFNACRAEVIANLSAHVARLAGLAQSWRDEAAHVGSPGERLAMEICADELAALLAPSQEPQG